MSFEVGKWSSTLRNSSCTVVADDILGADDYDEMFDMADLIGVNLVGLDEIDEMKERLLMHLRKGDVCNAKTTVSINSFYREQTIKLR